MSYLFLMVAALSLLLFHFRRDDRHVLLNTLGFCGLGLFGFWSSAMISALGMSAASAVMREASIIVAGVAIIRLWGMFVFRVVLRAVRLKPPRILEDIVVMLGYTAWGLVRLRYAGLDLSQIVTTSALITAVVAFSMQDTLGNILGGIALHLDASLKVGDWVRIDDVDGRVVDIRWRSTSIETRNWDTVVIPNSALVRNRFLVHGQRIGRPLQWRRWVWFNVDYSAASSHVIDVVENALRAAQIPHVAADPSPQCLLMDFEHGNGRYAVRYWLTDLARDDSTDSEVRVHVLAALQRAGMRIAVPEYSIHTVKQDEKHLQVVRSRDIARRLEALKQVDLFSELDEEELHTVSERLVFTPFARGDVMTRQGAIAHWLYILISGEADVVVERPNGDREPVAVLGPGKCFGEMGLLTGEPRHATVIARSNAECYRLDKASLEDVLHSRPALAEHFSRLLAARQADLDQHLARADAAARRPQRSHSEMLASIRRFFGLDHA
ncbi:MAG TPA: mechanosensitive ion channel family protein [Burkholderiales bacterium]|nr:mechanosensitive ion channel family protein [Burkholderiales bacterium]